MPHIELLDQQTIDKIAAGEVIERPSSVVKELVENAIDAGASAITVEIEEGGISLIRITDNGCGIEPSDIRNAFLRHSTSKIRSAEDLFHISSLGFRGEALSSIAAVSQVEIVTKTREETFGIRYVIEGGKEKSLEETGAPNGTTFLVRQLFYNVPARRKFLRTAMTEASHVSELLTRLALSHPEISFQFINNRQTKLHTSGNGQLRDVIYHIYGREIAMELLPIDFVRNEVRIQGFLGKPIISRGNRNFETYFVNHRYVKSNILSKAIEDAYKDFTMQHKYPFVVLNVILESELVDINVHPTKMELRFSNQQGIYNLLYEGLSRALHGEELIPEVSLSEPQKKDPKKEEVKREEAKKEEAKKAAPSLTPVHTGRTPLHTGRETEKQSVQERPSYTGTEPLQNVVRESADSKDLDYFMEKMKERVTSYHAQNSQAETRGKSELLAKEQAMDRIKQAALRKREEEQKEVQKTEHTLEKKCEKTERAPQNAAKTNEKPTENVTVEQLSLFEDKFLDQKSVIKHEIIGQVFDTYWIVQMGDHMYIIDQHAAHERVLYERTLHNLKCRDYTSQYISPPIVLTLSMLEMQMLETYKDRFAAIGFEIEPFGGNAYAVRAVPDNLFGVARKELLLEMLDQMTEGLEPNMAPDLIDEKIASMSCKAAVKGNSKLSRPEVETLIEELLQLENPYHCPHGRPTIINMTKRELEKKFKRIV